MVGDGAGAGKAAVGGSTDIGREREFEALRAAEDPAVDARWPTYVAYARFRERGERKRALAAAAEFLDNLRKRPFEERRDFVVWLFEAETACDPRGRRYRIGGNAILCPQPLRVGLVEPTVEEWKEREPDNPLPRVMDGTIPELRIAHQLDPDSDDIRRRLLHEYALVFDFYLHELPRGYLGPDASDDHAFLVSTREIAAGISDEALRDRYLGWLDRFIALTKSYADYLADGGSAKQPSFAVWARSRGRPASLGD